MEIFTAIGVGLVVIGAPLAWYGVHRYRKQGAAYAQAKSRWVRTRASVIDAGLIERESSTGESDSTWYEPHMRYRYTARDRPIEGERVALCNTPRFWSRDLAQKWLAAHPSGALIDLWYDPDRPEDSATQLDAPSLWGAIATVAVGAGFVALAGMLLAGLV